jgi:hypothetical protein
MIASRRVTRLSEIIDAFAAGYLVDELSDAVCGLLDGAGVLPAEQRLERGECLLDGIQVGAVGWQKEELGADVADGTANRAGFVAADTTLRFSLRRCITSIAFSA